jgi:tRNA threonylcarbamoyladenosine biosynthesis protein TsaB
MLVLAVDTSSPLGSLALLRDATVLGHRVMASDEPYSGSLLRDAKRLLDDVSISFEQTDLFSVNAGPGSFTGLRVGLTTVKGWAEVWGRPVAAVSGLEAVAIQICPSISPNSLIAAVTDARRGQIFGALFRRGEEEPGVLEQVGDEVVANADEFLDSIRPQLESARDLVVACLQREIIQPELERQGFDCRRVEVVSGVLAPFIGELGYAKALRGDAVDALHLDANYIRRSDAEMNWKAG